MGVGQRSVGRISTASISAGELVELLRSPYLDDQLAGGLCAVVAPIGEEPAEDLATLDAGSVPLVIIGIGDPARVLGPPPVFDIWLSEDDPSLDLILASVETNPVAATSLAVLLRGSSLLPVEHALAAESAVYSLLQSGSEFQAWKSTNRRTALAPDAEPAVHVTRDGDILRLALNRPARHNAFSRSMRDALTEMLALAVLDDSVGRIEISGNGRSFCSGGDLAEFGSFADPASAHSTRLARSPARLIHRIAERTYVHLHGACMGAGIELAAFASWVSAHPDSQIALPEISLGLIPGAGGTVSVTRRVGRQRCAQLALTGRPISARAALEWGLIDEIRPSAP